MKCFRLLLFLSFLFTACTNDEGTAERAESDLDAARMFIRDALDGKYEKAKQLMVSDSTNNQWIGDLERKYEGLPASEKRGYRESSITIHDTRRINDSSSVVVYSNTFKNRKDSVKVVHRGEGWLVDLKYTFQGSLPQNDGL